MIDGNGSETFCQVCSRRVQSEWRMEPSSVVPLATCSRLEAARPAQTRALLARATHCPWCPPPARRNERCLRSGRCAAPQTLLAEPSPPGPPASEVPPARPVTRPLQPKHHHLFFMRMAFIWRMGRFRESPPLRIHTPTNPLCHSDVSRRQDESRVKFCPRWIINPSDKIFDIN